MSIRKDTLVALLIIAALIGLYTSNIYAAGPNPAAPGKEEFIKSIDDKRQEIYNEIGVTAEQKKLLEENKNKHREQTKALFTEMRRKMDLLRQTLEKRELNMQEIYQINTELKQLQAQMLDNRLESILEVRKILSPGQFKKFQDKMKEHWEHFKNKSEKK